MLEKYANHNLFQEDVTRFEQMDPHLHALSQLKYQYHFHWWEDLNLDVPGIYMLTGGRQVGKSTSCKQLIQHCLQHQRFKTDHILYLTCDEIYDAKMLGKVLRYFIEACQDENFFLVIDEITFVPNWERVIKAIADEGGFRKGLCLITGSDTLILKEAVMSFPGRRGTADRTDFHLYPLSFSAYVGLCCEEKNPNDKTLFAYFKDYLKCGGYLRAVNDLAVHGEVKQGTFLTYEQWIRGDFLKQGKREDNLLAIFQALTTISVSQISYSALSQKIGTLGKDTCIDYCSLLERMDILMRLKAFDQNKKQGFPKKAQKFHFCDPFIYATIVQWLAREEAAHINIEESTLVEACVAAHCHRLGKTFYFKGQGEVDVIRLKNNKIQAIEVKWAEQIRPHDLKTLKTFKDATILTKNPISGHVEGIKSLPVYRFLYELKA